MTETTIANPAPTTSWPRLWRLLLGLTLCGLGIAAMVEAELGLGPWDVLHQGVETLTGIPIGTVGILVGVVVLLGWLPLRERPGVGTVLNVIVIGLVIDGTIWIVDRMNLLPGDLSLAPRVVLMLLGPVLFALGSGYYIGAGLGAGPRDGLMTGMSRVRCWNVGPVRLGIELVVLVVGFVLGGTVGIGTIIFATAIGPMVAIALPLLAYDDAYLHRRMGGGSVGPRGDLLR